MEPLIGVDVGKKHDPTALCVVEPRLRSQGGRQAWHFLIRHLERVPLDTPYPRVARRIEAVRRGVAYRARRAPITYIDATGVGTPVLDLLRAEAHATGEIVEVQFVHGRKRQVLDGSVRLGKRFLVNRLQALVQARRIHLPSGPEAIALAHELLDYEIRVDEAGRDRYGAFRSGIHDDLVTALGLAVQVDPDDPQR